MATVSFSILEAAHEDGFIGIKLSNQQRLYFERSVITANEILGVIAKREDANIEQIQSELPMTRNTLNTYLRWLVDKGYVLVEKEQVSKIYWISKKYVGSFRLTA